MKYEKLNKKTIHILTEAGWTLERRVDFSKQRELLEKEGWKCSSSMIDVIENLEELHINNEVNIEFGALDRSYGDYEIVDDIKKITHEEVMIIGETYQKDLLIGESGTLYIGDYPEIYFLANSIEEALNILCDNVFSLVLLGKME